MEQWPQQETDPYVLRPNIEDWDTIQGGMPRVFRDPTNPNAPLKVLHVYDHHGDADRRFGSGAIVETLPPSDPMSFSYLNFRRTNEDGEVIERNVKIPSMMWRAVHGDVCEGRSVANGGGTYRRITNQREYNDYIDDLRRRGFQELRFGVNPVDNKLDLVPLPEIRSNRPLQSSVSKNEK